MTGVEFVFVLLVVAASPSVETGVGGSPGPGPTPGGLHELTRQALSIKTDRMSVISCSERG